MISYDFLYLLKLYGKSGFAVNSFRIEKMHEVSSRNLAKKWL